MITLHWVYALTGAFFAAVSLLSLRDASNAKRWGNAIFWGLLALSMWGGDSLGDFGNGLLVIALTVIAGTGQLGRGIAPPSTPPSTPASAGRLFGIALIIPVTALIGTFVFKAFPTLVEAKQATLIALGVGTILALVTGLGVMHARPAHALQEGRRLLDSVGWAAILPQMLASLGAVFAVAGVGGVVGDMMRTLIPSGSLLAAVIAYGLGMALFTMIMGNAFAAFPVMMAAIGMPLLITQYQGDAAVVAAIGMLAGFCGTLMTPMAANFNLVPAALLELQDRYGVVRRQVATALPLLVINIGFIYIFAFR